MRVFLLMALAFPLLRAQPTGQERDAEGFGSIKWGMTVQDAKASFAGLREPERSELASDSFRERLIQPTLMMGSVELTVSIQTRIDSDSITRIVLKLAPFVQRRRRAFQFMRSNLVGIYGKPTRQTNNSRGRRKETSEVWALPSTTITLNWLEASGSASGLMDIAYEAVDKKL